MSFHKLQEVKNPQKIRWFNYEGKVLQSYLEGNHKHWRINLKSFSRVELFCNLELWVRKFAACPRLLSKG